MFGTTRRPSAEELQELIELTRRDPQSLAFIKLGEAYMALGKAREALDVGARGLQIHPGSTEGRMMVSRAFCMLHQWKQAQAELLKVVKADRSNAAGFLLLGEVLMRRSDYERALPVLQHAQNLDPANPRLIDLLRRVRGGEPLDPPVPVPTPQEPARAGGRGGFDDEDTRVAGRMPAASPRGPYGSHGAPAWGGHDEPMARPRPPAPAQQRTIAIQPGADFGGARGGLPPPAPPPAQQATILAPPPAQQATILAPPPPAQQATMMAPPPPAQQATMMAPPARPAASAPPTHAVPTQVRPRVLPTQKPRDAAQASLRQSAAMGESYLNNLLTAGLLDVPKVNAPEAAFESMRGKRWGRSTLRVFVFLFTLLFAGVAGGGYWFYRAEAQRKADVALHLGTAQKLVDSSTYDDLTAALAETKQALERDRGSTAAMAAYAKTSALLALLYNISADEAGVAIAGARREIKTGEEGWRDIVIAQAALTLATLPDLEEPKMRLQDARNELEKWLAAHGDDAFARWLHGVALELAGERSAAFAAFEQATANGQGPVLATISVADMLLDNGDVETAGERYGQALERAPNHPLAITGRALLGAETSADPADTLGELNVGLAKDAGPRVSAYKTLALALANYVLEDYAQFSQNLDKSAGVSEPRYLARVALGRILQGNMSAAAELRAGKIAWYGQKEPERHPLVTLVDAELILADGLPAAAVAKIEGLEGVRAQRLRGRALYDAGKLKEALAELDAALALAPEDLQAQVWHAAARLLAGDGKARRDADSELDKLGRTSNNKLVRYAHGNALKGAGRSEEARRKLELSLEEITVEHPNPLAYRAHTALAELDFADGRIDRAAKHLEQAIEQQPSYLPANGLLGRILLARGEHVPAARALKKVVDEPEVATAAIELAYAEALVSQRGKIPRELRTAAREAVVRAKNKGAPAEELARVAALVDPALVEELGIAVAVQARPPAAKGKKKPRRGR